MSRRAEITPLNTSFVNSTRFPSPNGNGGGESGIRGGVPQTPRRSSLPPLLPYPQIPPSFIPGPRLPFPMYQPYPPPVFSFGSLPPMSPAPSWLSYYPQPPVVSYNAALPPPPFTRPTNSLAFTPRSYQRTIRPTPVEIPVDAKAKEGPGEKESHGEATSVTDVSLTDYMDPDKIFYVYNEDDLVIIMRDTEIGKSSSGDDENRREDTSGVKSVSLDSFLDESPMLPPPTWNHQGVLTNSVDGNKIDEGVVHVSGGYIKPKYSSVGIREISLSDPNRARRILASREASARSNDKRARCVKELEGKVRALKREGDVVTANIKLKEKDLSELEEENKQLRIQANELLERLARSNALIEQFSGEDPQLKPTTDEVIPNPSEYNIENMEPLDANMFLNLNQFDQQPQDKSWFQ